MATALDPALASLDRREREGAELPIAVRRFRDHLRAQSAIVAMQQAAADVIGRYTQQALRPSQRVSAGTLCEICGIHLEGSLPRRASSPASPSAFRNLDAPGHSGSLLLSLRKPTIQLPPGLDHARARVAVAHELGHYLIHRRGEVLDSFTIRLPSSSEEEALSEYAARLLLLPRTSLDTTSKEQNVVSQCFDIARTLDVTLHSAAARLGDPDSPHRTGLKGIILWRLNPAVASDQPISARLTPQWHLCADVFIPIRKCRAGRQSLIAELASCDENKVAGSRNERVSIGSLSGSYQVHAVAWGSVRRGSRLVLSAFLES